MLEVEQTAIKRVEPLNQENDRVQVKDPESAELKSRINKVPQLGGGLG